MRIRMHLILPDCHKKEGLFNTIEKYYDEFEKGELQKYNELGYCIYYFPNGSSKNLGRNHLKKIDVDQFNYVFVDMDLKEKIYSTKEEFLELVHQFPLKPYKINDSGYGIHVFWEVNNLTQDTYLNLQNRLQRHFRTDKGVCTAHRLMRYPGYYNTKAKNRNDWVMARTLETNLTKYNVEDFDFLPPIPTEISEKSPEAKILPTGEIPEKFHQLLESNEKIRELYEHPKGGRSVAQARLANILQMKGYTFDEMYQIFINTEKWKDRADGEERVRDLIRKIIDHPLNPFDADYEQCRMIVNNQYLVKKKQDEIFEYELDKKYAKTLKQKELDKKRGIYTLRGTKDFRKEKYEKDISILENAIKNRLFCVTPELSEKVPLLGVELVLIGAKSGAGKTSTSVGLICPLIEQGKRVLYLSTEERGSDLLMRIAAIRRNININNRNNWTIEEFKIIREEVNYLTELENLMIVDNYVPGADLSSGKEIEPLDLTNLDQLKVIMESVERDGFKFDLLILDYISKIGTSDEKESEWQVLYKAIKFIEEWCKRTGTPSVVFTQLKEADSGTDQSFKARLPGSKRMFDAVTNAIEIQTDYDAEESTWICHKLRYGLKFRHVLKFIRGKYVDSEE